MSDMLRTILVIFLIMTKYQQFRVARCFLDHFISVGKPLQQDLGWLVTHTSVVKSRERTGSGVERKACPQWHSSSS